MYNSRMLADLEFQFTTGEIDYEEYRNGVKKLYAEKSNPSPQPNCEVRLNPSPGIAASTTLTRSGGMDR